jgi:hypothetical protein
MALDSINLGSLSEDELSALQGRINTESLKRKVKNGRERGLSFEKLEDIPAAKDHAHDLKRVSGEGAIETHRCSSKGCFEKVYHCPACSYVPGEPERRPYNDIGVLSGSKGIDYSCGICGTHLGRVVLVRS